VSTWSHHARWFALDFWLARQLKEIQATGTLRWSTIHRAVQRISLVLSTQSHRLPKIS
jgi:hypothetical protein